MLFQKLIPVKQAPELSYTFNGQVVDTVSRSTYTFTNVNIGTVNSNRIVYVVVLAGFSTSSGAVNSVTVGGVSCSLVVREGDANSGANNRVHCGIWKTAIPAGTTATVVVTNNESSGRATIATYSVYNSSNATVNTQTANGSSIAAMTMNVTGGVAPTIIIAAATSTTVPGTYTWSGVTENFDSEIASIRIESSASELIQTTATVAVTATRNTAAARYTNVAARIK